MPFRRASRAPRTRRRRIRKLRLTALLAVLTLLAGCSFVFGFVSAIAAELESLDPSKGRQQLNGAIYDADERRVLAVLRGDESRVVVPSADIDPIVKQAAVAVEDRRFYEHRGVDVRGIARALWADIRHHGVVQGGSTITQQFVKNAYVRNQRSIGRKVREAALAWQLEQAWDKDRILTAYLNTIYFGNGAYGIQQAARVYFGHGAKDMTLAEAALLAGIPADPTSFDPVTHPQAAARRRTIVLRAMLGEGYITAADLRTATRTALPSPGDVRLPGTQSPAAPYFANYVKEQLIDRFGADVVYGGGLRVTTTIDLELQELARKAIARTLPDEDGPEAAVVAIDPTTGNVLAMVGGRNFRTSQFNLATQSRRQPGSTFKPFVLAASLEQGISPATTFESKPLELDLGDKAYPVSNYEDRYLGWTDVGTAIVHSDNAVYVQLTQLVGPRAVKRMAEHLGITSPLDGYYSIGLGAEAVNPLELARAYAPFANGGYRIDVRGPDGETWNRPRVVESVARPDAEGKEQVGDPFKQVSGRVIAPRTAAVVNELLQEVIAEGTGRLATLDGWTPAGKTGTTENYGDAWFVGYTPRLVAAVWVGYRKEVRPMLTEFDGEPVTGGTFPAQIWKAFMERALRKLDPEREAFEPPPSASAVPLTVVQRDGRVRRDNGLCPNTVQVFYFADTQPPPADCRENEVVVPRVVGRTLADAEAVLAAQPLTPVRIYKPARAGERVGVVVDQIPPRGRLSSYDRVTLVLPKPLHGVVPNLRGTQLAVARRRLERLGVTPEIAWTAGPALEVVSQRPPPGVAAAPGMVVRLVVARQPATALVTSAGG